ncbi:MAG: nicotinamidase [Candidatus Latescibacterota bacterium]|nr:MAG: nicotinamidase [Candidatus Latescibacterota bacterium]RKY72756.1 MAG: nicotinamidase [Candidatus Latescibacterota bacterium]
MEGRVKLRRGDVLVVVDVQKDFLPGGSLAVPHGDEVVPVLARYIKLFKDKGLPIFATRDWHPPDHSSFEAQGGPWPPHCVQGSEGAEFAPGLGLPEDAVIISKATDPGKEAYSGFQGTDLDERLRKVGARRLFVGGLATDYCVLSTVRDALSLGYEVYLLEDGVRAVDLNPGDGEKAIDEMVRLGAKTVSFEEIS